MHFENIFNSHSFDINNLVQPPLTLVQSLIAANPEAVTTKNHYGMIPLRTAIRSQASTEVIGKIYFWYLVFVRCNGIPLSYSIHCNSY
jgi:hypothetical protein